MNIRQLPNKPVVKFLEQFGRVKSQCSVQLPEFECATVAMNNMHPQLKERLATIEYSDLAQLTSQASKVKQCIVEKE